MDRDYVHGKRVESVASPPQPVYDLEPKTLEPVPDIDLVWREEVEDVLDLADKALNASVPEVSTSEPERRFLAAGQPVRAPLAQTEEVDPTDIERRDGFVPADEDELARILRQRTIEMIEVDSEVVIDLPQEPEPVRIVYEFSRPVYEASGVYGTLYTVAAAGHRIPFQAGVPTSRLVQIIQPDEYPRQPRAAEKTLNVQIEGGRVHWTFADE